MSRLTHKFFNPAHEANFTMRIVGSGDHYGRNMSLIHSCRDPMDSLVEFYDCRWDHDRDEHGNVLGQFVSRYSLRTLLEPFKDGRTVFDTGITLDGSTAWRVDAAGMQDCLRVLQKSGLAPVADEDRIELLTEILDEIMEQRLEYAESHKDAGDAYSHLPREGDWSYGNGDQRLAGWMRRQGIDACGLCIEDVSELVLDSFRMEAGTILDPSSSDDTLFVVGSFPVGEIEEQIETSKIGIDASDEEWAQAMREASAHFDNGRGYLVSDRVWYAVIDEKVLRDLIAEATISEEPEI